MTPVTDKNKQKGLFHTFLAALTVLAVVEKDKRLDKRPHVSVTVQDKKLSVLVDTGATVSIMSQKLFDSLPGKESFEDVPMAHGFSVAGIGATAMKCSGRYLVPFDILGIHTRQPVYVMDKINNHAWIMGIGIRAYENGKFTEIFLPVNFEHLPVITGNYR